MKYKEYIGNHSVILNSDGKCEINCPGCSFGERQRDKINKIDITNLKRRIDFSVDKFDVNQKGSSLILHPGNVLLDYSKEEIIEILEYSSSKVKIVQWELEKIDEQILDVIDYKEVKNLIKEERLFLNVGYVKGKSDLLKKIFGKIAKIGLEKYKDILEEKGLLEEFEKLTRQEKFEKIKEYVKDGIFKKNGIFFSIHFDGGEEIKKELYEFITNLGFDEKSSFLDGLEKNGGDLYYRFVQNGILLNFHSTMNQKIDKNGNNIWEREHLKGNEGCILFGEFEWSIGGDKEGTILPHVNPCINKISFGNLDSTQDDIEKAFIEHKKRISNILIKYKYTKNFDQSELCKICLNGEEREIGIFDIIKYKIRKIIFNLKESLKN